jgi:hypothetical protein
VKLGVVWTAAHFWKLGLFFIREFLGFFIIMLGGYWAFSSWEYRENNRVRGEGYGGEEWLFWGFWFFVLFQIGSI